MLAFYMDHQFPAAVSDGLRRKAVDVLTAHEDGSARLADDLLLDRATRLTRVLVTHDQGFLELATRWQASGRDFAGIAFAVQRRMDIGKAIEYLELMAHLLTSAEMHNRVEYIPARTK